MKNLFLTAFAVLALSSVGFAKSNAKNVIVIKTIVIDDDKATPCQEKAMDIYMLVIGDGPDNLDFLRRLMASCN